MESCYLCSLPYSIVENTAENDRHPWVLNCTHTVCQGCIKKFIQMIANLGIDEEMPKHFCPECSWWPENIAPLTLESVAKRSRGLERFIEKANRYECQHYGHIYGCLEPSCNIFKKGCQECMANEHGQCGLDSIKLLPSLKIINNSQQFNFEDILYESQKKVTSDFQNNFVLVINFLKDFTNLHNRENQYFAQKDMPVDTFLSLKDNYKVKKSRPNEVEVEWCSSKDFNPIRFEGTIKQGLLIYDIVERQNRNRLIYDTLQRLPIIRDKANQAQFKVLLKQLMDNEVLTKEEVLTFEKNKL